MKLLLDSHTLLWWLDDSPRLGNRARSAIADATVVAVSLATIWEIAIKVGLEKLSVDLRDLLVNISRDGFDLLPVTSSDCLAVAALPRHHGDPFDRMLIAQAQSDGLVIVTADPAFAAYDVDVLPLS